MGHATVPHHHYFDLPHSLDQESPCEDFEHEKDNEDFDFHCHSLNIFVSGKQTNSTLTQSLSAYLNFFIVGIIFNIEIPQAKNVTIPIYCYHSIFAQQFFFTSHSLRAPPVNA